MTKAQQLKINRIRRNMVTYCSAPVFSNATLEVTEYATGDVGFQVTNPGGAWYEGLLCVTGYITKRGQIALVDEEANYAKQLVKA
jgi:hypothetical protein